MKKIYWPVAVLLFLGVLTGCGKKGPPMLPAPPSPVLVEEASAEYRQEKGVVLTWKTKGDLKQVAGFLLSRGKEKIGETACRSCEEFYHPLVAPPLAVMETAKGVFTYIDQEVEAGNRYFYRIEPTYENGSKSAGTVASVEAP